MQRAFIVITQAVIDVQFRAQLPGVLREEVEGIHEDLALGITQGNRGCRNIPRQKIGQSIDARIARVPRYAPSRCGPLRAIEGKASQRVTMIELIQLRLAEFSAKFELVPSHRPGVVVREMARNIVASLRWGLANRVETLDRNIRSARKR